LITPFDVCAFAQDRAIEKQFDQFKHGHSLSIAEVVVGLEAGTDVSIAESEVRN
jgi:hypothetical protein